jgi:starch-binding outer membrane protein, SusD/RagB family
MKTKFLLFFSILTMVGGLFSSCSVDEKIYSQNTPSAFFSSKSDLDAALAGIYKPLTTCCGGPGQAGTFVLNSASDEGNAQIFWGAWDQLTYTATGPTEATDIWNACFQSISRSNFVLSNQEKINTNIKNDSKAAIAEAKFLRAYNYFQLVRMFGGVPLRLKQVERADEANIPRNTEDEVYAQIIKDFSDAELDLPATGVAGKPTKLAATAFLAKVYLTRKDFPNALTKANAVVASGQFTLLPKYSDVFNVDNENNLEIIFALQYIRQDGLGMRLQPLVLGPDDKFAYSGTGGWGLSYAEDGFYEKFNPIDDRLSTTFANPTPGLGLGAYHTGKWRDSKATTADGHGNDFVVLRFADIVLIQAEAENEVNGPTAAAYASIKKVRDRAKLPALTSGLSKDQFRDAVILERHLELSWEQHRWFDLKRTGKLKDALTAIGKNWNDKYLLFPIPQTEVDVSNKLVTQNPGY